MNPNPLIALYLHHLAPVRSFCSLEPALWSFWSRPASGCSAYGKNLLNPCWFLMVNQCFSTLSIRRPGPLRICFRVCCGRIYSSNAPQFGFPPVLGSMGQVWPLSLGAQGLQSRLLRVALSLLYCFTENIGLGCVYLCLLCAFCILVDSVYASGYLQPVTVAWNFCELLDSSGLRTLVAQSCM